MIDQLPILASRRIFALISLCLALIISCQHEHKASFSRNDCREVGVQNSDIHEYCNLDPSNPERNAVISSLVGDYEKAILYATERAFEPVNTSVEESAELKTYLEQQLNDSSLEQELRESMSSFLEVLKRPEQAEILFSEYRAQNAEAMIAERSASFQFTFINEAHYSSRNRLFTLSLLKPLWDKGYRYLALEGLGYRDSLLQKRGYPINESGYYIRESSFGKLVREALKIGYTLVAYETQKRLDGSERDRDQAVNIIERTIKTDPSAKILVHVGYSHLNEKGGSSYTPLGAHIRELTNQDILTIDQIVMLDLADIEKVHPYYKYVKSSNKLNEPTVFVRGSDETVLIDAVNHGAIDIQVYLPPIKFVQGRPEWLFMDGWHYYSLPEEITNNFKGYLIQARSTKENLQAVPYDQLTIEDSSGLVLTPGSYCLTVINCNGENIEEYTMQAN